MMAYFTVSGQVVRDQRVIIIISSFLFLSYTFLPITAFFLFHFARWLHSPLVVSFVCLLESFQCVACSYVAFLSATSLLLLSSIISQSFPFRFQAPQLQKLPLRLIYPALPNC